MTLFLVGTPIGNLEDITLRAIRILNECDFILCEDTRNSRVLLNHLKIKKELKSYHKFNEKSREDSIFKALDEGKKIGLISDAGMPCIADPGQKIVAACRKEGYKIEVIPGPSSILTALSGSGWDFETFQFIGFLPKKSAQAKRIFDQMVEYDGVTIAFETKHRIIKTLQMLVDLPLELCVAKELTKHFETYYFGSASSIIQQLQNKSLKGEFVVLFRRSLL